MVTTTAESVAESVNLDLEEILVLVCGSIPPSVPFRRRCQPVLGSLLGSVAVFTDSATDSVKFVSTTSTGTAWYIGA